MFIYFIMNDFNGYKNYYNFDNRLENEFVMYF